MKFPGQGIAHLLGDVTRLYNDGAFQVEKWFLHSCNALVTETI